MFHVLLCENFTKTSGRVIFPLTLLSSAFQHWNPLGWWCCYWDPELEAKCEPTLSIRINHRVITTLGSIWKLKIDPSFEEFMLHVNKRIDPFCPYIADPSQPLRTSCSKSCAISKRFRQSLTGHSKHTQMFNNFLGGESHMNYLVSFSKARKKDASTKFNLKKNQHSTGCGFGLVAWVFLIRLYFDQRKTVKKRSTWTWKAINEKKTRRRRRRRRKSTDDR